ncbi:NAD(P)/FAD-dependent oxidoreductase [Paenibacillus ginsengarvi]|uniref:NAD(P)/FAD-dependent oxidoreductase n=1 Tax=Paenibacillus ginsengarvi TaxID=400777 RepID=A0A3B0C8B0_9BACL|nr:NAD(P)/FAD-dependent oxidoreductase [Paenibacillus ginsengarvi]RKN80674.1 NAD(P)/FAD-dependent oxidoreductase [Paenibacillus ginsengarvi]
MSRFVILGGGYGGLTLALHLLEQDPPAGTEVVLVDRMPYQGLKTEYYALAAGTVSEAEIRVAFPSHPRLILKYGEVKEVDLERKLVLMNNNDTLSYDWLVIGLGCVDKYHGIEGAEMHSHSIQTLSGSRKAYQALNDLNPYSQVSVVGGGLSGVEIASELRESRPDLNIRVIDRGPSILSSFPDKLQSYVREWFTEHDVEMLSHISLSKVEPGILHNGDEQILTDLTVWTAGIQPSPVVQQLNVPKDAQGRVLLNEYHQIPEHPEVYVIGDCASLPFSPSAQAAEEQGKQVAEVMHALWKGETPQLKTIKLKGVLGSLGKKAGFGMMGKKTVIMGKVPRVLKSGVLWMSKHHFG